MPRRFHHAQGNFANAEFICVFDRAMRKRSVSFFPENNLSTRARSQLTMPAHEISMKVSLNHVLNLQPLSLRFSNVLLNVALRINNCRFTVRAYKIGSMS